MKKSILMVCVAVVFSMHTFAQQAEEKEALQGNVSTELSSLILAGDLVKYGYARQEALPLIQALQIIVQNPTQNLNSDKEGESVDTSDSTGKTGAITLDYDQILADAKEFAMGDEVLTQLIAQIESEETEITRGALNGPRSAQEIVKGNGTDTYQISFVANYLAEIAVIGDGDTDLDLYVYDSNGNLIVCDTDYTDACYVCWVPKWTGRFIIKIVNRGPVYNRYVIATN